MITIIKSKTFPESTTQAVVNFVDCSGNAINFDGEKIFEQNQDMLEKYLKFCEEDKIKPGMVWYYKGKDKEILNFAISESNDLSEVTLNEFKNGLLKLKQIIENKNIKSVAITNIVQLNDVIDLMLYYDEIFYDCDFDVEVYNYKMICDVSPKELVQEKFPDKQKTSKANNSLVTHITYPENTVFHI